VHEVAGYIHSFKTVLTVHVRGHVRAFGPQSSSPLQNIYSPSKYFQNILEEKTNYISGKRPNIKKKVRTLNGDRELGAEENIEVTNGGK
jgi:hypothetical protein